MPWCELYFNDWNMYLGRDGMTLESIFNIIECLLDRPQNLQRLIAFLMEIL